MVVAEQHLTMHVVLPVKVVVEVAVAVSHLLLVVQHLLDQNYLLVKQELPTLIIKVVMLDRTPEVVAVVLDMEEMLLLLIPLKELVVMVVPVLLLSLIHI